MTTNTWIGNSAPWLTPADWDQGSTPGPTDVVFFNQPGTSAYLVTIGTADSVGIGALTLNASAATIEDDGTLSVSGLLSIAHGTLLASGLLLAGSIVDGALLAFSANDTLSGMPLSLTGGGTLQVRSGGTLTLATDENLVASSNATINSTAGGTESVVNQGSIVAAGGSLNIVPFNFTNTRLISVTNEAVTIGYDDGRIGGTRGPWCNGGTIVLAGTASLNLDGLVTTAGLGTIIGETNRLSLSGVLDNTGAVLTIGSGSAIGQLILQNGAVISGGTIVDLGNGFSIPHTAYFSGAIYQGPLNFADNGGVLYIANGLTAVDAGGAGPGTINVTGGGYQMLDFTGSQTIDNATINLNCSASFNPRVEIDTTGGYITTLTLGPDLVVNSSVAGSQAYIENAYQNYTSLINQGTIIGDASGGSLQILQTQQIINQGSILVSNGENAQIATGFDSFVNAAGAFVSVGAGSALFISTPGINSPAMSNAGTIAIASGGTLLLHGFYNYAALGNLVNSGGTVVLNGGEFDLTGTTLTTGASTELNAFVADGQLQNGTVLAAPSLIISTTNLVRDTVLGELDVPADFANLTVEDNTSFAGAAGSGNGTITLTGQSSKLSFANQIYASAGQILNNVEIIVGNSLGADTIVPAFFQGTFAVGPNTSIVSNSKGARASFANGGKTTTVFQGTISALAQGGTFTLSGQGSTGFFASTFYNDGTLLVGNGDTFKLTDAIFPDANNGTIDIGTHGTFDVGGSFGLVASVGTSQTLNFTDNTGMLKLRQPTSFGGTIDGFRSGDTIDLPAAKADTAAWSPGSLTVSNAGTTLFNLAIGGDYTGITFTAASDGTGGTAIAEMLACFATGTLVTTTRGERAVERLHVGDLVPTADGSFRHIVWIGHRRVDCRRHPHPTQVWPVRVAAGAFGIGRPDRDLYLSPDHAIYAAGVLIPVKRLINGTTITRVAVDAITYWHVELDCHDVLLAQGLPVESYLDTGDRTKFADSDPIMLHPDFPTRVWEMQGCAPLHVTGPYVEAVRQMLAHRAAHATRLARRPPRAASAASPRDRASPAVGHFRRSTTDDARSAAPASSSAPATAGAGRSPA